MFKSEKIKLLFSTPSVSREIGGIFEVERNLALEFYHKGIHIDIISLIDRYTEIDMDNWLPLKPVCHEPIGFKPIGYSKSYLPSLINSRANIGHIHSLWSYTSYALYIWAKTTKSPYILTPNGMLDKWALNNSKWKKKPALFMFLNRVLKNAACIQVNTMHEYISVREFGLKNPVCLISNGIKIPDLNTKYVAPWEKLGLNKDIKVLLFLSRIHPKKGVDILLEAWKKIVSEDKIASSWHLVIVGFNFNNDSYENKLKAYVNENKLNTSVSLLQGQYGKDMEACYAKCTAYILPSLSEGVPIAVLNAFSFAKLSIITGECNLPIGFETKSAIKIDPNVESVQKGIKEVLNLSQLDLTQYGERARKLAIENFSWHEVSNQLQEVYEWVLNKQKIPSTLIKDQYSVKL
jgi:glycosyltransferase involved in cell wall biosynthesis